jgi:UPF0755 protein
MNDNRDAINDILSELDRKKELADAPPEAPAPEGTAPQEAPEPEYEPIHEAAPEESSEPATSYTSHGYDDAPRSAAPTRGSRPAPQRPNEQMHRKKKRRKKASNRLPGVLILTTLIFGISIILSLVIISFGKDMLGIGESDNTQLIVVPEGANTEEISELLKDEGVINSPKAFQLFSRMRKSDKGYVAGQHFVRPNMAYEAIIDELTKIPSVEKGASIEITFPEGITLIDAANLLEENHICDAKDFIFYFNSGGYNFDFEKELPIDTSLKFEKMEGYLFPDTYFFFENSEPEEVCQKIYYNFNEKMTPERMAKVKASGLSLDQVITFASIVQKEAPTSDVMTMVASVFWNRLENPDAFPLLQSDPTSNYANDVIRPNMEYFDETFVNAYDTYKSAGLPPGAICNPGTEAIDAVLEHFKSDNYYFIANIYTKETFFSETLEEHNAKDAEIKEYYEEVKAAEAAAEAEGE